MAGTPYWSSGETSSEVLLVPSMVPQGDNVILEDSTFFRDHPRDSLPTPQSVRAEWLKQHPERGKWPDSYRGHIAFHSLGVFVKFGTGTTSVAEGQSLVALRRLLPEKILVPEVYGWLVDGGDIFLYMQLIRGVNLQSCWTMLSAVRKDEICRQISGMLGALQALKQDPEDPFIGCVGRQALQQSFLRRPGFVPPGPFVTVNQFHEFLCWSRAHPSDVPGWRETARQGLPDDSPITFCHGNLRREHIMIDLSSGHPAVVAIVDWQEAGWMPAYWEYCRCWLSTRYREEWQSFVPNLLRTHEDVYESWELMGKGSFSL